MLMAAMFIDGPEFVSVLAQFDIEGNILTKFFFFKNPPSGGDAITKKSAQWRRCDSKKMFTDRRKDGRTDGQTNAGEKLLWTMSRRANDHGAICEGIIHTLRIQLPGELYADGNDMWTHWYT